MEISLLSAGELMKRRKREPLTATSYGSKDSVPDFSEGKLAAIKEQLEHKQTLLTEENVAKMGHLSIAEWQSEIGKAKVTKLTGRFWHTMGHVEMKSQYLLPEEMLFLMETSQLEVYMNGLPLALQAAYQLIFPRHLKLEHYQVYANLMRLGYVVVRHGRARPPPPTDREKVPDADPPATRKRKVTAETPEVVAKRPKTEDGLSSESGPPGAGSRAPAAEHPGSADSGMESSGSSGGGRPWWPGLSARFERDGVQAAGTDGRTTSDINPTNSDLCPTNSGTPSAVAAEQSPPSRLRDGGYLFLMAEVVDRGTASSWTDFKTEWLRRIETYIDENTYDASHLWSGDLVPLVADAGSNTNEAIYKTLNIFRKKTTDEATSPPTTCETNVDCCGIFYDVHLPDSAYKKSALVLPSYHVTIVKFDDPPPAECDLHGSVPWLLAAVETNNIAFYSFSRVHVTP